MKIVKFQSRNVLLGAALLVSALNGAKTASAVPLSSGAGVSLRGTTNAARPELAGVVLQDRVRAFSITSPSGGTVRGTFQDRVVKREGTGKLEFSFRIKSEAASTGNIVVVNRQNYGAFPTVDVDFRLDGLGTVGALAAAHGGGSNARIKFDFFNNPIKPGSESRFHFIGTDATSYDESGQVGLQTSNGGYASFKVFSPKTSSAQPTPAPTPTPDQNARPNLRTTLNMYGGQIVFQGQDISNRIKVYARNIGSATAAGTSGSLNPANGFVIDVMLAKRRSVALGYATYSPNYSDGVLLLGGRISNTRDLAANGLDSYSTGATIPTDTPPGRYFLALRIDSGDKVNESDEDDNTFFLPLTVRARKTVRID